MQSYHISLLQYIGQQALTIKFIHCQNYKKGMPLIQHESYDPLLKQE